jgi:hypothetical protein
VAAAIASKVEAPRRVCGGRAKHGGEHSRLVCAHEGSKERQNWRWNLGSVTRPRQRLQMAGARGSGEGFCGGRRRRISRSLSSSGREAAPAPSSLTWIWGWRRGLLRRVTHVPCSLAWVWRWRRGLRRGAIPAASSFAWIWERRHVLRWRGIPAASPSVSISAPRNPSKRTHTGVGLLSFCFVSCSLVVLGPHKPVLGPFVL